MDMRNITIGIIKEIVLDDKITKEEKMAILREIGDLFHNSAMDIDFGGDGIMEDW